MSKQKQIKPTKKPSTDKRTIITTVDNIIVYF